MKGRADILFFHEHKISSLREMIGDEAFLKSDVIKQAVGLRARYGLDLETLILKFTNKSAYVSLSYQGRPDDDIEHEINGVVTQIFSDRSIHLQDIHPITYHAFEVIDAGIKANQNITGSPDLLFKITSKQLIEYLELMCLENMKDVEHIVAPEKNKIPKTEQREANISTKNFQVESIYSIDLFEQITNIDNSTEMITKEVLSSQVGFYGQKRDQYSNFLNYIIPFLSPIQQVKAALLKSSQIFKKMEINPSSLPIEKLLPDIIIFNDNGKYRVLLFNHTEQDKLKDPWKPKQGQKNVSMLGRLDAVALIEDNSSNMGIAATQSYIRRKNWNIELLSRDFDLNVRLPRREIVREKRNENMETGEKEPTGVYELDLREIELYEGGAI